MVIFMEIILASNSPRRKEILESLGYKFRIAPADIDENIDLTGERLVCELAKRKALRIYEYNKESIVIGSDTIVYFNGVVYNKPKNEEECYYMLKSLSGKCHEVMSGLTVIYKEKRYKDVVISKVYFRELTDDEIKSYVDSKEPFGKAGSYAIQGIGNKLVDHYEGSLNNIIGLPTEILSDIVGEINGMED